LELFLPPLPVLYEDNHLLVIDKPAGIATQGVTDGSSVYDLAREYLRVKYNKPGNVYLGIVSRLDTVTSGVLVLARTSKAASRLSKSIRESDVEKHYLAVVEGVVDPVKGTWRQWVRKDEARHRMIVCRETAPDAKLAELRYRTLESNGRLSRLELKLITGRKHQIRVQMSDHGHPIVGDRKYDATTGFPVGIALHAAKLVFAHPTTKERLEFASGPPASWKSLAV